jgi:Polysaccharide pyruvyl transferase
VKKQYLIKSIVILEAEPLTFGCILPIGGNIGDDIQAIAAAQFLPEATIYIERDFLGSFQYPRCLPTLINGWFMRTARTGWNDERPAPEHNWPPPACIDPLLISIHLEPDFVPEALSEEGIRFFRSYGPVGARDTFTHRVLEERGVPSYFSECLTLTLANPYKNEARDNIVYVVDLPSDVEKIIRRRCKMPVVRLTHHEKEPDASSDNQYLLSRAEIVLEQYRRAKCVITSRLHAAMPCLAFETPVVLVHKDPDSDSRMGGLIELVRHCSPRDVLKGRLPIDPDAPTPNSSAYCKLRSQLVSTMTEWVRKKTLSPSMMGDP